MATAPGTENGANTAAPAKKPKAKRGEGIVKLRPAYLVYSLDENNELVIHTVTRKADVVLAETAGQTVKKYALFEI